MSGPVMLADRRDTSEMPVLQFRLLGGFTVTVGGQPIAEEAWRGQKVLALLKLLALAPAQRLARDQLLDMLWPDFAPDAAAGNLYGTLTAARKFLANVATLRLRAGMVALHAPEGVQIDMTEFTLAASRARVARAGGLPGGPRLVWGRIAARRSLRGLGRRPARDVARDLLRPPARPGDPGDVIAAANWVGSPSR